LQPAVAAQRAEDIARQALGVNAYHRRPTVDIAHHQRDRTLDLPAYCSDSRATGFRINPRTFEAQNAEMTPTGREIRICDLLNTFQWHIYQLEPLSLPHVQPA
jgi:hypothetical protein